MNFARDYLDCTTLYFGLIFCAKPDLENVLQLLTQFYDDLKKQPEQFKENICKEANFQGGQRKFVIA